MFADFVFPPRLTLAQTPTPLQPLRRLSQQLGGPTIWVKRDDLTGSVLSGNKVRKLEFVLAEAIQKGCTTVITCGGVQSNHCRATAILCAQLGLKCHLVLRGSAESPGDGNLFLDQLVGATMEFHRPAYYSQHLTSLLRDASDRFSLQGERVTIIPTGASDGLGIWGYINASYELMADFALHKIEPSTIYCATGSGGTQAGLTLGLAHLSASIDVVGIAVCDNRQYFLDKVMHDMLDWQRRFSNSNPMSSQLIDSARVNVNDHYIGPGYARAQPEVIDIIRHMAQLEGLILDPVYTGKGFLGLVEEIKLGRHKNCEDVVFVHTGGVFGLFPQRHQFSRSKIAGSVQQCRKR